MRKQKMTGKPSDKEDEYFIKMDFDKELHFMRCPMCGMELIEIYYNGVHTEKCSECGGIWLDEKEFELLSKTDKSILNGLFGLFTK
jgi:hypothetical protein